MEDSLGLAREAWSIQDIRADVKRHAQQQVGAMGRALMHKADKLRVLIVEDEVMISMMIEDMVCDLGGEVVGPAPKFEQAMALALEEDLDLAVLDVNLDGLVVYPIADVLRCRNIPFIFMTGYDSSVVPQRYQHECVLSKPFSQEAFGDVVRGFFAEAFVAPPTC